jgi:hypothetical protein
MVPGTGIEPARYQVPADFESAASASSAFRLFEEVLDSKANFTFYVFFMQDIDCETVKVNVEVFVDFHRSLHQHVKCFAALLGR